MMGRDGAFAETLRELARDPFRHAAGVDEHERGAVLLDQPGEADIDLGPHLVRHHSLERRIRDFHAQVARPLMSCVDDGDLRAGPAVRGVAGEEMGDGVDRFLRCGEADPLQAIAAERRQPFERQREMGAAFVWRDGVDFVDDDRAGGRKHRSPRTPSRAERRATPASSPGYAAGGGPSARARRAGCRRFGPRCGFQHRQGRCGSTVPGCRPAGPQDCGGYRSTAP